ncbi:MAG: hypothetical protein WBV82_18305 [Myxococcaceae bacterium]
MSFNITEQNANSKVTLKGTAKIESCDIAQSRFDGRMFLEYWDRDGDGKWVTAGSTSSSTMRPGVPKQVSWTHNTKKMFGRWRVRLNGTLSCIVPQEPLLSCVPTKQNVVSRNHGFGAFFKGWNNFNDHYEKHVVTQKEWGTKLITRLDYLNRARTDMTYARKHHSGKVRNAKYSTGINSSNVLVGYDEVRNEFVFIQHWNKTYPYLGTYYVWKKDKDPHGCSSGYRHFRRVAFAEKTGCKK